MTTCSFCRTKTEANTSKSNPLSGGKGKSTTSNGSKLNAKKSSSNTLSVGPRRERSSSLANIYSRR